MDNWEAKSRIVFLEGTVGSVLQILHDRHTLLKHPCLLKPYRLSDNFKGRHHNAANKGSVEPTGKKVLLVMLIDDVGATVSSIHPVSTV